MMTHLTGLTHLRSTRTLMNDCSSSRRLSWANCSPGQLLNRASVSFSRTGKLQRDLPAQTISFVLS